MPNDEPRAFVALGTNLPFEGVAGAALLERALEEMMRRGLHVRAVSSAWQSEALPRGDQPDYVNAVALVDVGARAPAEVFAELAGIEKTFGRTRRVRWGARTLDLDIIDMPGAVAGDGIDIPHSRLAERAFVLAPFSEVAPEWRHPITGRSVEELLWAVRSQVFRRLGPLSLHVAQSRQDD